MDSEIVISVNLPGKLGTRVEHTTYQKYTINFFNSKTERHETITRNILHTNRKMTPCMREVHISPAVVNSWVEGPCPYWVKLPVWKKATRDQKIQVFVATFDEGYGVKYE